MKECEPSANLSYKTRDGRRGSTELEMRKEYNKPTNFLNVYYKLILQRLFLWVRTLLEALYLTSVLAY